MIYRDYVKRPMDVVIAIVALIAFSPIMTIVAVSLVVTLGFPVVFSQPRPGRWGVRFTLYKFRTMTEFRDKEGNLLPDALRLPRFGRFLRETSLDELPELFNVLKGEMSIVGPRPLLIQYLTRYTPDQFKRHHVLPGITGWAQVNGRNALTWDEKFTLDIWYIDNCSLLLDLKIIILTVWTVLRRTGISRRGEATMSEFMGTQSGCDDNW